MAIATHETTGKTTPWLEVLHDWVSTVDHKKIGILYVLMAVVFLFIAGSQALLMRLQLWQPHLALFGTTTPDTFNQLFTMHGTTMVFFVGMPILIGIANYWLATLYGGRLWFASPMLFAFGFLSLFVIGGLTGIILAAAPLDFQLSDTYTLVGFHALHVTVGVIVMLLVLGLSMRGDFGRANHGGLQLVCWYWHFVDGVWIVVFTVVYLVPHLA